MDMKERMFTLPVLKRSLLITALVLVVFTVRQGVAAEDRSVLTPEARKALQEGLAAAQNKDYKAAIRSFEEARKTSPYAPELLFNLGLAESKIQGRELAAMVWLKAFLAVSPEAPEAQKVRDLCDRLDAAVVGTIKKLIDLDLSMLAKAPEAESKWVSLSWISSYQTRLGDFAGARKSAELGSKWRWSTAYDNLAKQQAASGDVDGALKTAESALRKDDVYWSIAIEQAKMGDVDGVLRTAKLAPQPLQNYYGNIQMALADHGHVDGIIKFAQIMNRNPAFYIARAQATEGDFKGALKNAENVVDLSDRDLAYYVISNHQAHNGDLEGAKKTASLISPDSYFRKSAMTTLEEASAIETASGLLRTRNSVRFRERLYVLMRFQKLIDTLNSPKFPWLFDLPAYLSSLNTLTEPERIEWSVRKALMGELEGKLYIDESSPENGGILSNLEAARDLLKK